MIDQEYIFDENVLRIRKQRAKNKKFVSFLHELAITDLKERLLEIKEEFLNTLIIGTFAEHWKKKINLNKIENIIDEKHVNLPPNSQDLIISALHLHSVNDPISVLVKMRNGLKNNGVLIGYAFGERSLFELRKSFEYAEIKNLGGVSPRVHPMIDTPTYGALLRRSGFNFCVSDKLHYVIEYKNPLHLITDLRGMGETNSMIYRSKKILTKKFFEDMLNFYKENFLSNKKENKYKATFDIICFTGWNSKPKRLM